MSNTKLEGRCVQCHSEIIMWYIMWIVISSIDTIRLHLSDVVPWFIRVTLLIALLHKRQGVATGISCCCCCCSCLYCRWRCVGGPGRVRQTTLRQHHLDHPHHSPFTSVLTRNSHTRIELHACDEGYKLTGTHTQVYDRCIDMCTVRIENHVGSHIKASKVIGMCVVFSIFHTPLSRISSRDIFEFDKSSLAPLTSNVITVPSHCNVHGLGMWT